MSVNSLLVINEAAEALRDPAFSVISQVRWLSIQNRIARLMARKMRLVEWTAIADATLSEPEYAYPDDCFQTKRVSYNPTPSDPTTWYKLGELFEDEFDRATQRNYQAGDPLRYYASTNSLFLYPMPGVSLAASIRLKYWGLPDPVTSAPTQSIPVADTLRDMLLDGMIAWGLEDLKEFEAAAAAQQKWQAALSVDRDRLEDKSADRRSRLRPRSETSRYVR